VQKETAQFEHIVPARENETRVASSRFSSSLLKSGASAISS
jgi:hypothetical protein